MIRFQVFGTLELRVEPEVDTRSLLAQSKHVALLGCLLVGSHGLHRRERLAALLWPELDTVRARNALSKAVHNIRRTLGDDVLILRGNDAIGINVERVWCDAAAFDTAVERGELKEALALYRRGEVMEGFSIDGSAEFEQWLDSARLRFRQSALEAATQLANDAESARELAASVRWSRYASEISPHDETVLRQLLMRLVQSGDHAGALSAYREFAERLNRDLEAEPSPETRALADSLRTARANGNRNGQGNGHGHSNGARPKQRAVDAVPQEVIGAPNDERGANGLKWHARRMMALAAAAAIVSTALLALPGSLFQASAKTEPGSELVAVSPIRIDTGDSSLKSMADMATGGIVQQLTQSSTGVIDLRNAEKDGQDANRRNGDESRTHAREAGAGKLVGGRMYAKGDSVYVNLQVTDAKSGRVLHQLDQYASPASNPYLILGRIKEGVAGAIAALSDTLYLPWSRAHSRPPTFAAFSEFLQGLDAIVNSSTEGAAFKHFKAAIVVDTTFVQAKIWLLEQANLVPEERTFVDSVRLVAVAQREGLGEFDRLSLDRVLAFMDGRWEDAYEISRRLVEIAPTTPDAHLYLAQSAMATRRYAEAVRTIDGMDRTKGWLRNLSTLTQWDLISHRLDGDLAGALAHWKRAREDRPTAFGVCTQGVMIIATAGREASVDSLITECMKLPGASRADFQWQTAGRGFRAGGNSAAARRAFQRSIALMSASNEPPQRKQHWIGVMQCNLGEWKSAYENLRASTDSTDSADRGTLAVAAVHAGDTAFAKATLEWMEERDRRLRARDRDVSERAFVHIALGNRKKALSLLRQAMKEGRAPSHNTWYARFELEPLRKDPTFQAMIKPQR